MQFKVKATEYVLYVDIEANDDASVAEINCYILHCAFSAFYLLWTFTPPVDMMMYWIQFLKGSSVTLCNDEDIKMTYFRRKVSWWQRLEGQLDTLPCRLAHCWKLYFAFCHKCI